MVHLYLDFESLNLNIFRLLFESTVHLYKIYKEGIYMFKEFFMIQPMTTLFKSHCNENVRVWRVTRSTRGIYSILAVTGHVLDQNVYYEKKV